MMLDNRRYYLAGLVSFGRRYFGISKITHELIEIILNSKVCHTRISRRIHKSIRVFKLYSRKCLDFIRMNKYIDIDSYFISFKLLIGMLEFEAIFLDCYQ